MSEKPASIFREHLLKNKIAFVTGGGSGIGQRMAERFAEHGAKVMLVGRKQDKLDAAAGGIRAAGGFAETAALDVRDYGAVEAAVKKTREEWGEIDIVVCGAAGNFPAPVTGMSANGFKSVIDIDLLGTFNVCRAAYEALRKPGASVISISANHANVAIAYQAHVCAAKAGIELLMKTLAIEWGREGIRANLHHAGSDGRYGRNASLAPTPEARAAAEKSVPLGRYGTKDELADLALFLCSPAASYITGSVYHCDGGTSLTRTSIG